MSRLLGSINLNGPPSIQRPTQGLARRKIRRGRVKMTALTAVPAAEESDVDDEAKAELMSIVDGLSPDARTSIAALPEERVIKLHFGLGAYIRNQIRQGGLRALYRWSRTQVPEDVKHFDSVTWPIVVEVWRAVKSSSNAISAKSVGGIAPDGD
jgi:hypothetical protein